MPLSHCHQSQIVKNSINYYNLFITVPERVRLISTYIEELQYTWWRYQMETFSALLAICTGNSPVPGEFPTQRPVTRSFDVFFDLRLNKRLSKQPRGWWFETPSWSLWRHRNARSNTVSQWINCHFHRNSSETDRMLLYWSTGKHKQDLYIQLFVPWNVYGVVLLLVKYPFLFHSCDLFTFTHILHDCFIATNPLLNI